MTQLSPEKERKGKERRQVHTQRDAFPQQEWQSWHQVHIYQLPIIINHQVQVLSS
jgi:hypothetical protein